MPCPICDQKPANCDCTAVERRQCGEIEDLECEVSALKERMKSVNEVAVSRQEIIERLRLAPDEREAIGAMASYFDTKGSIEMQAWGSLLRVILLRNDRDGRTP